MTHYDIVAAMFVSTSIVIRMSILAIEVLLRTYGFVLAQ
jgi:hypothetical protein